MQELFELQAQGKNILDFALHNTSVQANMTDELLTHLQIIALGVSSVTLGSWENDYTTSLQSAIRIIQLIVTTQ